MEKDVIKFVIKRASVINGEICMHELSNVSCHDLQSLYERCRIISHLSPLAIGDIVEDTTNSVIYRVEAGGFKQIS